jgi:NADPH2:quinone reductase
MEAMAIERFGSPDIVHAMDLPKPVPAPNEILVEVVCAGVNPVDWKICAGGLQRLLPYDFPIVLGWDVAGIVREAGAAVSGFKPGDRVYAYLRKPRIHDGSYAEFVTVDAAAAAPMPANLDFCISAAVPLVTLTAYQALFEAARLLRGQTVLIHGGAGGVGGMAIQLAKDAGTKVYATAREPNHDYLRQLGADRPIDYIKEVFVKVVREAEPGGVDVVLDTIGEVVQAESYKALRRGGVLVSVVGRPKADQARLYDVRAEWVFVRPDGTQLRDIAQLFETGRLRPPQVEVLPLERAAEALERSRTGHVRGKLALRARRDVALNR